MKRRPNRVTLREGIEDAVVDASHDSPWRMIKFWLGGLVVAGVLLFYGAVTVSGGYYTSKYASNPSHPEAWGWVLVVLAAIVVLGNTILMLAALWKRRRNRRGS